MKNFLTALILASPVLAQIPCYDANLGPNLGLTDESFSPPLALGFSFTYGGTPYTDVQVCSNGYIVFGTGSPLNTDYTPTAYELCNNAIARVCALWMDFDPAAAGGGGVHANAVPASGSTPAYFSVTWNGVYRFGTTIAHTVQVRFVAGGAIETFFGGNVANNTTYWLHGASPGNGATGNAVWFTALPIATAGGATLHQAGIGSIPLADTVMRWSPDGLGGYVVTSAPSCATKDKYGTGCVANGYASFYQHFQVGAQFDLSNTALTGLFTGSSYTILNGTTSFVAPSINATNLALGDDGQTSITLSTPLSFPGGSTSTLFVCSNGFVSVGSNGTGYQPAPVTFLNWVNATWAVWHDFIPNGSNNVMFEEASGFAYITWDNVISTQALTSGVTPSTFQFQFELATGNFHIVFLGMDTVSVSGYQGGDGYLVGWSPSGANVDPGNTDLSSALAGLTALSPVDATPLKLAASGRPVLGSTVSLDITNIPVATPFGAVLLGLTGFNPGVSLTSIGMPGCFRYTDGLASVLVIAPTTSASVPFASPAAPVFLGLHVYCQGVTYSPPLTPLGAISSNGVDLGLGN